MIPPAINDKSNLSRGATCRLWWIVWATPIPPHAGSSFSRRQKIKLISIEQSGHFCQRSTCKLVLARFIRSSYSQVIRIVSTANTKRYWSWHRATDLVHSGLLRWIGVNQSQIIDMCRRRNNDLINTTWTFRRQNLGSSQSSTLAQVQHEECLSSRHTHELRQSLELFP